MVHTVKGFGIVNKAEIDVVLELSCFSDDPTDVGNLISGFLSQEPENQRSNQQWPQDWKRSVFIPIPKKGNAKECSNYCTIVLISHTSKVMLKILQIRPQQYVNHEMFKLDLEKAEEPEIKLSASAGSSKKRVSSSSRVGDLDNTTTALMPQARVEELDGENKIPTPQRS